MGEVDSDEEKSIESGSDTEMTRQEDTEFEPSKKKMTLQSYNDFRVGNRNDTRSPIATHRSILKARREQNHLAKSQQQIAGSLSILKQKRSDPSIEMVNRR